MGVCPQCLHLYPDPIAQLRGVNTQVSSDDPMGIVRKNTANDLHETWRRPSPNTNCWNRKSLHSFRNRDTGDKGSNTQQVH